MELQENKFTCVILNACHFQQPAMVVQNLKIKLGVFLIKIP